MKLKVVNEKDFWNEVMEPSTQENGLSHSVTTDHFQIKSVSGNVNGEIQVELIKVKEV